MLDRLFRRGQPNTAGAGVKGPAILQPPLSSGTTFSAPDLGDWYSPVLIGADVIGQAARSREMLEAAESVLGALTPDPYVRYLQAFYSAGRERFGDSWGYADITTVLTAAGRLAQPRHYLEIGVRRGRSLAMVAAANPHCNIVGFDMWMADYAGIENPGPDFVRAEIEGLGHKGRLEFVDGNSHETVPAYFASHPDAWFDLITVDGDHTPDGAAQDLRDVITRLAVGGVLVFDDIVHPAHAELAGVWREVVGSDPRFSTWMYGDVGYGVAVAVRRA